MIQCGRRLRVWQFYSTSQRGYAVPQEEFENAIETLSTIE